MAFRIGQSVVCIKYYPYNIDTGQVEVCPNKDDIVIIIDIKSNGWLTFEGYPSYLEYEDYYYRPLHKDFVEEICEMIMEEDLVEIMKKCYHGNITNENYNEIRYPFIDK